MSDTPTTPTAPGGEADPTVTAALRSMASPPHGYGFWATLDARLTAERAAASPPPFPPRPPPGPPDPPPPEVVLLPSPGRRGPARWLIAVAAALILLVGIAAIVRASGSEVEVDTAATTPLPEPPTSLDTTTVPLPSSTTAAPTTLAPVPTSSAPSPSTSTTRPAGFTVSPNGVGPLRLGMTTKQATATGAVGPYENSEIAGDGGCGGATPMGAYRPDDFAPLFVDGKLVRLYIGKPSRLRTPQGIGVGSAVARLSTIPGTRTESPHPYQDDLRNVDILSGDVGYQFTIGKGVVTEWSVGTRDGLSLVEGCA